MEEPKSPTNEEWIRYKRYATHNLPQHMQDYITYKSKISCGILTRTYFTNIALSLITEEDKLKEKKEKKCKRIFKNNYFGQFKNNYEKFKNYSLLIGSYDTMKYVSEKYDFYYIKENYPEYIEPEEFIEIEGFIEPIE